MHYEFAAPQTARAPFWGLAHFAESSEQNVPVPLGGSVRAALFIASMLALFAPGAMAQQAPPARQLAPGVLTTIPANFAPEETVSTHDLVEIRANPALQWNPEYLAASDTLFGLASNVKFRRDVWCLEFAFKPMRMIEIDVPLKSGGSERKLVWYMVYRVRNTGQTLKPVEGKGGVYTAEIGKGGPIRFLPKFVLESKDREASGEPIHLAYLDRLIPAAVAAISQRETPGRKLLNTVEIAAQPIPVSDGRIDRSVWGVVTWTDIEPRMDFFSVYVGGLSNAYQWQDTPAAYKPGDPPGTGRQFVRKTLQLNFWRPGDELMQTERELRYGVPPGKADVYDVADGVAYRWLFR
jgi:hypothetical protein